MNRLKTSLSLNLLAYYGKWLVLACLIAVLAGSASEAYGGIGECVSQVLALV